MDYDDKLDFAKVLFNDDYESKMKKFRRKFPKLSEVMAFEFDSIESETFIKWMISQKILIIYYFLEEYSIWYKRRKKKHHHQRDEYFKDRTEKVHYLLSNLQVDPITDMESEALINNTAKVELVPEIMKELKSLKALFTDINIDAEDIHDENLDISKVSVTDVPPNPLPTVKVSNIAKAVHHLELTKKYSNNDIATWIFLYCIVVLDDGTSGSIQSLAKRISNVKNDPILNIRTKDILEEIKLINRLPTSTLSS